MPRATCVGRPNILEFGSGNTLPGEADGNSLRDLARESTRARKLLADNDNKPTSAHAVYVISDIKGMICKIGRAQSPAKRLATVQTGNAYGVYLHRVFWVDDLRSAENVERRSHEIARHFRLQGEWFECPVNVAHTVILKALDEMNIDYAVFTPTIRSST